MTMRRALLMFLLFLLNTYTLCEELVEHSAGGGAGAADTADTARIGSVYVLPGARGRAGQGRAAN